MAVDSSQLKPSSSNTSCGGLAWLIQRLGLAPLLAMGEKKLVPVHKHSVWYYLGGIALVFIAVQVLTGLLLMVYYIPELSSAHASILALNTKVAFGWFIRSLHSWGANLMIAALFVHLFSTFFMRAYRPPREFTWLTGLALLVLSFGFGFTGYLLPWDEVAYFATKIGLDITSQLPVVGEFMATLLRGGDTIGQATLSRFFVIHVIVLPLSLIGLVGLHLWLVQSHGISEPPSVASLPDEKKSYEKFFPTFALKDAMVWLLVINLLAVFVTFMPWGLGPQADAFAPAPAGIKPEWYFLAMFQFLKYVPAYVGPLEGEQAGLLFFMLIGLTFAAAPFIDNGKRPAAAKFFSLFGWVVLAGFVVFTLWGFAS